MEPCPSCPCIVSLYSAKSPPPHLLQQTILSFLPFSACSVFSSNTLWNLFKITLLPILHILALHILRTLHSFLLSILRPTLLCFPPYMAFSAPPQKLLEGPNQNVSAFCYANSLLCIYISPKQSKKLFLCQNLVFQSSSRFHCPCERTDSADYSL